MLCQMEISIFINWIIQVIAKFENTVINIVNDFEKETGIEVR